MPTLLRSLLLALVLVTVASGCTAPTRETPARTTVNVAFTPLIAPRYVREIEPTVGERVAKIAVKAVGVPYRWGGASPVSGFDCSGLVHWAYARLGIELPHSSYALYDLGRQVAPRRMEAGDLLFFYGLGHVGVYLGGGRMVHAPRSGRTVEVVRLAGSDYGAQLVGVRRIVPG
jgi:cell wall-associated NlpC family hydrolase